VQICPNCPDDAVRIHDLAKSKLEVPCPATDDCFARRPWEQNISIAGYTGFLNLQELVNISIEDSQLRNVVIDEPNRLLQLRASNFAKDSYYQSVGYYANRMLNVSRNFIMLVPQLGDYLNQNVLSKVQATANEYDYVGPYWFVVQYNASISESALQNL
jgi:hypothetical protein